MKKKVVMKMEKIWKRKMKMKKKDQRKIKILICLLIKMIALSNKLIN